MKTICPHCQQKYNVELDLVGSSIECPKCNNTFIIKGAANHNPSEQILTPCSDESNDLVFDPFASKSATTKTSSKRCPMCGEEILAIAKKCKHCGEMLERIENEFGKKKTDLGVFMFILPVIGLLAVWFWIPNIPLIHDPGGKLLFVTLAVTAATAILAAVETKINPYLPDAKKQSPVSVGICILLLWVVCYPAYMYMRKRMLGLPNMIIGAIIIAILFAASTVIVGVAIDSAKVDIIHQLGSL